MKLKELLNDSIIKLKEAGIKTYQLDTIVLLSFFFKKEKEWLYLNKEKKLSEKQIKNFKKLIKRRKKHEPIAYILRYKEFYGLDFLVNNNVLIPRPETEELIFLVLKKLEKINKRNIVADIGTGSGCIAVVLSKKAKNKISQIIATDTSKKALMIAKKNAQINKASKIIFSKSNLLNGFNNFDIIISNPPYVTSKIKLSREVKYEPSKAIFEQKNFIEKLIIEINKKLKIQGFAFLEIDPTQKNRILKIIKQNKFKFKTFFKKDLFGKIRFVILEKEA